MNFQVKKHKTSTKMSVEYGNKVGQVDVKLNKKYGGKVAPDFKNHTTQSELNYTKTKF